MTNRTHDQQGFITWADVLELMEQMQRETNTTITLHVQLAHKGQREKYLTGSLRADRITKNGQDDNAPWVGFRYPNGQSKTITGALVERLYVLHEYIDRQEEHEKRQLKQADLFSPAQ